MTKTVDGGAAALFAEESDDDAVGKYPALQEHDDAIVVDGLQLQQQTAARDAVHGWQRPAAASRRGDPSSGRRKRRRRVCRAATLDTSGSSSHVAFIFRQGAAASATGTSQPFAGFFISPRYL